MRYYYSNTLTGFFGQPSDEILGALSKNCGGNLKLGQILAWRGQIEVLKGAITFSDGEIYFEYSIPRLGRRIDTVIVTDRIVFVLVDWYRLSRHETIARIKR